MMNSSRIHKIAKARRYAEEPGRVQFLSFEARFQGENDGHTITFRDGQWQCTCHFFQDWDDCCHTMAMQRILGVTLPASSRPVLPVNGGSALLRPLLRTSTP
jgi:hypothetical protein